MFIIEARTVANFVMAVRLSIYNQSARSHQKFVSFDYSILLFLTRFILRTAEHCTAMRILVSICSTKYIFTTVSVPSSNWAPTPSPASEGVPPPRTKGRGTHSLAGEDVGGPNSDDRQEKKPGTLSTLSYTVCLSKGQPETTLSNS
jgi:hypothetical protein